MLSSLGRCSIQFNVSIGLVGNEKRPGFSCNKSVHHQQRFTLRLNAFNILQILSLFLLLSKEKLSLVAKLLLFFSEWDCKQRYMPIFSFKI